MIDLHCHVLPGIDDGPATMEDSVALARAAARGGTTTIVATPHVTWDMDNDAQTIATLVERELVHNVASDAHDALSRPPAIADDLRRSGYEWFTEWAAEQVPAAILSGEEIPPRPPRPEPGRRRWWRWRR